MQIESLASDRGALVPLGSTVTLHCLVTRMDTARFVQFGKLLPTNHDERVIFTTNTNVEATIRDLERYSVDARERPGTTPWWGRDEHEPELYDYDFTLRLEGEYIIIRP